MAVNYKKHKELGIKKKMKDSALTFFHVIIHCDVNLL